MGSDSGRVLGQRLRGQREWKEPTEWRKPECEGAKHTGNLLEEEPEREDAEMGGCRNW